MAMSGNSFRMIIAITAYAVGTAMVDAAEIRVDTTVASRAVLEGKIEAGDLDKLQRYIFDGDGTVNIFLASPGGDLAEAMKIGRLVRALKLATSVPAKLTSSDLQKKWVARYNLKNAKANYMCASACFLVFVAGIHREVADVLGDAEGMLGIHRPFLPENELRKLGSKNFIAASAKFRAIVKDYFKEMGVPAKYADQMFSVPKDQIRWIKNNEFAADFSGFIPELKHWVDARCNNLTEIEKRNWEEAKHKNSVSPAENVMSDVILKKREEQDSCERRIRSELALRAYRDALEMRGGRTPQPMIDKRPVSPRQ